MIIFQIAGILPDSITDKIIPYNEITSKFGADFDYDKQFVYVNSYLFDSETKKLTKEKLYNNEDLNKLDYNKIYNHLKKNEKYNLFLFRKFLKKNNLNIDNSLNENIIDLVNSELKKSDSNFIKDLKKSLTTKNSLINELLNIFDSYSTNPVNNLIRLEPVDSVYNNTFKKYITDNFTSLNKNDDNGLTLEEEQRSIKDNLVAKQLLGIVASMKIIYTYFT